MNTNKPSPLIRDGQSLVSATTRFDHPIPTYDDAFGPLFVFCDSMGVRGIIRAQSWEDAYSIAEDEMMDEATLTWDEIAKECECSPDELMDNAIFQEAYGFRPNGANATDKMGHGIYARDLNGESLSVLTADMVEHYGIKLVITSDDEDG